MKTMGHHFIPVLTTAAGNCLTSKNWQEVGVRAASFALTSLLIKPGYEFLNQVPDLKTYLGWDGALILNAFLPKTNDGTFKFTSPYDGQKISLSSEMVVSLIEKLKPDVVILPEATDENLKQLPETIFPFVPLTCELKRAHGIYLTYNKAASMFSDFMEHYMLHKDKPCYVAGDFSLAEIKELTSLGVQMIESDKPANDAYLGTVYCTEGDISLQNDRYAVQFDRLDKHCHCPTCNQGFTRAYLHHLLAHTPLLCQRLLIQHNVHYLMNT
jgi:queuine tRNA-ribosyltransferase